MKSKILTAAVIAFAAGIVSSQAQVYSQNIVGYVNTVNTNNHQFVMIANPMDNSSGNTLTNIFQGINGGSSIQVWNGAGFDVYSFSAGHWSSSSGNADNFVVPPGTGVFLNLGGSKPYTNTYVGSVSGTSGATVTNLINSGLQLVGSLVPFADSVTNTSTINLIAKGGSSIQQWDKDAQKYVIYSFSAGSWAANNTFMNGSTPSVPFIKVGEGFFFKPNGTSSNVWVEAVP